MSLFRCEECGCVENTAIGCYWGKDKKLCSECGRGKWHGQFEKRSAKGMLIDQDNHLWSKEQVEAGLLPQHYRIVGEVSN
jgi:hypothetical protein